MIWSKRERWALNTALWKKCGQMSWLNHCRARSFGRHGPYEMPSELSQDGGKRARGRGETFQSSHAQKGNFTEVETAYPRKHAISTGVWCRTSCPMATGDSKTRFKEATCPWGANPSMSMQRYQSIVPIPLLKMSDLPIKLSIDCLEIHVASLGIHIVCVQCGFSVV